MSLKAFTHRLGLGLLLILVCVGGRTSTAFGQDQEQITRKVKTRLAPQYPDLAKRMNIAGTVRLLVTVDKSGSVKTTKLIGGHPILAQAALDALRKWRYESGPEETTGVVEFRFDPNQ